MLINNANLTGSLTINNSSFNVTNGVMAGTASLAITSSYAATASYASAFNVGGTLTAQTLVVQTVSSSVIYSSGSNVFGNNIANTQVMTGSVTITGSLAVVTNGTEFQVLNTGVRLGNVISDAHSITGSVGISGSATFVGNVIIRPATNYNALFQINSTTLRINYLNDAQDTNISAAYRAADFVWQNSLGASAMVLTSGGNVGLGVTPSAWRSTDKALQINTYTSISSNNAGDTQLINNAFFNSAGSAIYLNTAQASRYEQYQGVHAWYTAPSGTAGNAITFTQAMTLTASGNLGIGTTSPIGGGGASDKTLSVNSGAGAASFITGMVGGTRYSTLFTSSSEFVIETNAAIPILFKPNGATALTLANGGAATFSGNILMGYNNALRFGGSPYRYSIYRESAGNLITYFDDEYDIAGAALKFRMRTTGTPVEALTILGSGAVTVGGALTMSAYSFASSAIQFTRANTNTVSPGSGNGILVFAGGNAQMRMDTSNGINFDMFNSGGTTHTALKIQQNGNTVLVNSPDNTLSLGLGYQGTIHGYLGGFSSRLEAYSNNGGYVYLSSSSTWVPASDIKRKRNFETYSLGLDAILGLQPKLYNMDFQQDEDEKQVGLVAQEVKDFIPLAYEENNNFIGLNYNSIIVTMVNAIKEQQAQITTLQEKLERNNII
jgi:hypothetical protein